MSTIKVPITKTSFANKVLESLSRSDLEILVTSFISLSDARDVGDLTNLGLNVDEAVELIELRKKIFSVYE